MELSKSMGPDHGNGLPITKSTRFSKGYPGKFLPIVPPMARVGSRVQNFDMFAKRSLRTLWTFFPLRPIMGHEICWKKQNRQKIEILWPRIDCKKNCGLYCSFFVFQRNSTTQIVYLTSAVFLFFRRNLVFRPMVRRNSSSGFFFWFCVVDFCWWFSLGCLLAFFRRNSASQNVRLSSADLGFFSAEIHKSGDALLPMIPCCIFISRCGI